MKIFRVPLQKHSRKCFQKRSAFTDQLDRTRKGVKLKRSLHNGRVIIINDAQGFYQEQMKKGFHAGIF